MISIIYNAKYISTIGTFVFSPGKTYIIFPWVGLWSAMVWVFLSYSCVGSMISNAAVLGSRSFKKIIYYYFYYCCAGCGCIIVFTKVLTMYQIYHTWIHHLSCCLSSSLPWLWNSFNRYHFSICIHVWTLFVPYSSSYLFPCHLPPSTNTTPPTPWRTCSTSCSPNL
jgi:hypothetical protein